MKTLGPLLVGLVILCASANTTRAVTFNIIDLGTLGGTTSEANGINACGQVVGTADTATGLKHAFVYSEGAMSDLGTIDNRTRAFGMSINASGQVAGWAADAAGDGSITASNAFLCDSGTMTDLGALAGRLSAANGINDRGEVAGGGFFGGTSRQAFVYSNGTMTKLGMLRFCAWSDAQAINASGQVVGTSGNFSSSRGYSDYAYLYTNGATKNLGSVAGKTDSEGCGINNSGQVVGKAFSLQGVANGAVCLGDTAFLFDGASMIDLGTLPGWSCSCACGINNNSQVVGSCYDAAQESSRAFLCCDRTMLDLNSLIDPTSGWILEEANAINDAGQIVGRGINAAGQTHAFLLTPVPEPSTPVLFGIGAVSLLGYCWRKRRIA
jgi:probable HAF family extracellular repeat protein